jgi:hypothetical protein
VLRAPDEVGDVLRRTTIPAALELIPKDIFDPKRV